MTKDKYSFIIEDFKATHEEHGEYKKLINSILYEIYGQDIQIDGMFYVVAQDFDNPGSYISIINKAIGNIILIKWFIKTFEIKSLNDLISFVINNKYSLFQTGGIYFNDLHSCLKNTEKKGIQNEKKALKYIKSHLLKKRNYKFKIRRTTLCSKLDVIDGIDIIITTNDKEYYVQVKPLKHYKLEDGIYEIHSAGKIKIYKKIHYYIFINDDECLLFSKPNLQVFDGVIYAPIANLKN